MATPASTAPPTTRADRRRPERAHRRPGRTGRPRTRAHHAIFELALCDANPKIAHLAEKLTAGKGYADPLVRS